MGPYLEYRYPNGSTSQLGNGKNRYSDEIQDALILAANQKNAAEAEIRQLRSLIDKLQRSSGGTAEDYKNLETQVSALQDRARLATDTANKKMQDAQKQFADKDARIAELQGMLQRKGSSYGNYNKRGADTNAYNDQQNQGLRHENATLNEKLANKDNQIKYLQQEIGTLQEENNLLSIKISDLEGFNSKFESNQSQLDAEVKALRNERGTLILQNKELSNTVCGTEEQLVKATNYIQQLEGECKALREEKEGYQVSWQDLQDQTHSHTGHINSLEGELSRLREQYEIQARHNRDYKEQLGRATEYLKRLENDCNILKKELEATTNERSKLENQLNKLDQQHSAASELIKRKDGESNRLKEDKSAQQHKNLILEKELREMQEQLAKAVQVNKQMEQELEARQGAFQEAQDYFKAIQEAKREIATLTSMCQEGQEVEKNLLQLKTKGERMAVINEQRLASMAKEIDHLVKTCNQLRALLDEQQMEIHKEQAKRKSTEKHLDELKKQLDEAKHSERLADSLRQEIFQKYNDVQEKLHTENSEKVDLKSVLSRLKHHLKQQEKANNTLNMEKIQVNDINEHLVKINGKHEADVVRLLQQIELYQQELVPLQEELERERKRLQRQADAFTKLQTELADSKYQCAHLEGEVQGLEAALEAANQGRKEANEIAEAAKRELAGYALDRMNKYRNSSDEGDESIDNLKAKLHQYDSKIAEQSRMIKNLKPSSKRSLEGI